MADDSSLTISGRRRIGQLRRKRWLNRRVKVNARSSNETENKFVKMAIRRGWKAYRSGWPDYLVQDESGKWFCAEIKNKSGLMPMQRFIMDFLTSKGIECVVYTARDLDDIKENRLQAVLDSCKELSASRG